MKTDSERARHVRQRVREMLNSRGEWEKMPAFVEKPVREIFVSSSGLRVPSSQQQNTLHEANPEPGTRNPELFSVLAVPAALEKTGQGILTEIGEENGRKIYG